MDGIYQDYAIGVARGEDHFESTNAVFPRTSLLAGEDVEASFDFEVRRDVDAIDELLLSVRGQTELIHVAFAGR
jgi:hypothetical protein